MGKVGKKTGADPFSLSFVVGLLACDRALNYSVDAELLAVDLGSTVDGTYSLSALVHSLWNTRCSSSF
jgi:hypothetical protein